MEFKLRVTEIKQLLQDQHLEENKWIGPLSSSWASTFALISLIQKRHERLPWNRLGQDLENGLFLTELADPRLLVPQTTLAHVDILTVLDYIRNDFNWSLVSIFRGALKALLLLNKEEK